MTKRFKWVGAAINIGAAYALILLQGWIGAGIQGSELFPWWPNGVLKPGEPRFLEVLLAMAASSIALAALLIHRRRTFLPARVQRIGEPDQVAPRQVLILSISRVTWTWTPQALMRGDVRHVLPADLSGALRAMAALGDRDKFSWEQLLRAVAAHKGRLERLILLGSSGADGTATAFRACGEMIRHYFPSLAETALERQEADFDSLDDLLSKYQQIIASEVRRKGEIMIDVTGGTKVVSIASAMVTLDHPDIEFQYVETNGGKRVRTFNVTTSTDDQAMS